MNKEKLSVIIVSFNSAKILIKNLEVLIDENLFNFVIVDNGSDDDSAEVIKIRFPNVKLISLQQNVGYGRAANLAIKSITTPFALLLNPDLSTTCKDINKLVNFAENDTSTAIWGPATNPIDYDNCGFESVEWISGCAMLFNVKKFVEVGLFDENIFLFFEETDLCKRIINAGYSIKLCRNIFFDHNKGKACKPTPEINWLKNWHYGWSKCYFYSKHRPDCIKRIANRQYKQYRRKWLMSLKNKTKYKAQSAGVKAFILGQKAFNADGTPNR